MLHLKTRQYKDSLEYYNDNRQSFGLKLSKKKLIFQNKIYSCKSSENGLNNLLEISNLEDLYYSDFYFSRHNVKTHLGEMVYIGKNLENYEIIQYIAKYIKPSLKSIIESKKIKYIAFIPPSRFRKVQLSDQISKLLDLKMSIIPLKKHSIENLLEQKSIRDIATRKRNAEEGIFIGDVNLKIDGNVLIFDDMTETGSTLNEVAKKIKSISSKNSNIYGYTILVNSLGRSFVSDI